MNKQPNYDSLTPRQKRFVDKYIQNGGNQSQAYQDSGYAAKTSSAIRTGASNLRNRPDVVKAIKERVQPDEMKRMIKNKQLIEELLSIALGELREEVKEDERYQMTPAISDQLNAISLYHKIVPLRAHELEESKLKLELIKSQIEMNNARIGMDEDTQDRVGQDIASLINAFESDDDDEK